MDVKMKDINYYQTELIIDNKKVILSDMNRKEQFDRIIEEHRKARRRKVGDAVLKVVEAMINVILVVAFVALMLWFMMICVREESNRGHWEADYINEEGIPVDVDGDGDVYHWVSPQD